MTETLRNMAERMMDDYIVLLLVLGYTTLTIISLVKWNEATSGALITGYALFCQSVTNRYFAKGNPNDRQD